MRAWFCLVVIWQIFCVSIRRSNFTQCILARNFSRCVLTEKLCWKLFLETQISNLYVLAKVLVSFKKLEFWNYFNPKNKLPLKFYDHDEGGLQQFSILIFVHFVEKNLFTLPFSTPFRGASKAFTFYKRRQILKIEESVPTDNGNYSCLVSNRHGQVQRFFTGKYFLWYILQGVS